MDSLFPLRSLDVPDNWGPSGWIYVFSNYCLPGCVKIGHTTRGVLMRRRDLQAQTANPGLFLLELFYHTESVKQHESNIFALLQPYRWNKKREFFAGSPAFAYRMLKAYFGDEPGWIREGLKESLNLTVLPLTKLGLSIRAMKCLESEGIATIGELCNRSAEELQEIRNFGETTLAEVRQKLAARGLRLRFSGLKESLNLTRSPLNKLGLSVRAMKCLESEGIATIGELCSFCPEELLEIRNFAETTLTEVRQKLSALGLRLHT